MCYRILMCVFVCLTGATAFAAEQPAHPGAAVYARYCAACHDQPDVTRAPPLAALQQLNSESLLFALTQGVMQEQATDMSRRELAVLVDYLALKEADNPDWYTSMMCPDDRRRVALAATPTMPVVGVDLQGSRYLSAEAAGLSSAELENLELAWAIGFPDTSALRSSPVIIGTTMFYTAPQTGRVLALDVHEPCVKWIYEAGAQVRSSIAFGNIRAAGSREATGALVFADQRGLVHAVNAADGQRLWAAEGRHSPNTGISGSPVVFGDTIIVPVSGSGVGRGANPEYECCAEHGAVVALDAATGEKRWTWHTMPDATYTGKTNRLGVKLRGPSGAPIWSTPTIDGERWLVYATSGQNTSLPATKTSDAVLAIDLETGELVWGFQALANDVWIIGCREPWELSGPNCPSPEESVLKDFDFGGSAILVERPGGDILLAGQKSGDVWALDPDDGSLLWNERFGQGTPLGGVHWGLAVDDSRVFAPISDPGRLGTSEAATEPVREPGMNALEIATGEILWRQPVTPDCSPPRRERFDGCDTRFGLSAVPLVVDRSVIAGAVDGRLYIYDAATGEVTFRYDTLRDFDTVNGVSGKGGSIDAHSIAAGAGMVFVGSGYGRFGQPAGNVLLAFKPRAR
jgi:polyvinyl alcohol dehydrogenase (cytochrome)